MIEIKGLNYSQGAEKILDHIDLTIQSGKIIGVFGKNGAGKTSLFNCISGLTNRWRGEITIDELPVGTKSKEIVSYMTDQLPFSGKTRIDEAMDFYQKFYADYDCEKCKELLAFFEIDKKTQIKNLSKGTIEKAHLALTLARRASYFLLDEPFSGVDLLTRESIIRSIIYEFDEKSTILISSHNIGELESVLDEVIFIDQGKILFHREVDEIRAIDGMNLEQKYRAVFSEF